MRTRYLSLLFAGIILALLNFLSLAEEKAPQSPAGAKTEETNSMEVLRTYLQLQEQLRGLQLALIEKNKEAEAAAARNAQAVAGRLEALEHALGIERARDLDAVQSSNRLMLIVSIAFAVVGLLAVGLMAYQWRSVTRLAEISTVPAFRSSLHPVGELGAPNVGERALLGMGAADQSNTRLVDAMERLERRIHHLEHTSHAQLNLQPSKESDQGILQNGDTIDASTGSAAMNGSRVTTLLGKGQSLLSLDKPEEALTCFDEVLELAPRHTDALIKKAMALERLRKLPEALACYDRAIAADGSLTIAYLYKGGLFNRMERFAEALECYEQALRAQEKG